MDDSNNNLPQECRDAATWQDHLTIARYVLLGVGTSVGLFSETPLAGLSIVLLSLAVYFFAKHLEIRHLKWHVKQEEKIKKPYKSETNVRVFRQKEEDEDDE